MFRRLPVVRGALFHSVKPRPFLPFSSRASQPAIPVLKSSSTKMQLENFQRILQWVKNMSDQVKGNFIAGYNHDYVFCNIESYVEFLKLFDNDEDKIALLRKLKKNLIENGSALALVLGAFQKNFHDQVLELLDLNKIDLNRGFSELLGVLSLNKLLKHFSENRVFSSLDNILIALKKSKDKGFLIRQLKVHLKKHVVNFSDLNLLLKEIEGLQEFPSKKTESDLLDYIGGREALESMGASAADLVETLKMLSPHNQRLLLNVLKPEHVLSIQEEIDSKNGQIFSVIYPDNFSVYLHQLRQGRKAEENLSAQFTPVQVGRSR